MLQHLDFPLVAASSSLISDFGGPESYIVILFSGRKTI